MMSRRCIAKDDGLFFHDLVNGFQIIAQAGRALEIEFLGRSHHVGVEFASDFVGVTSHERGETVNDFAVFLFAHAAHARGRTFIDIAQQTRPAEAFVAVKHTL